MAEFWICLGMLLWNGSEYSSIPSIPGFWVCKCCTRFWIWLNMADWCPMEGFWVCLINVWRGFQWASGSKCARAQNTARIWIKEGYTECWICLNKSEYTLIISQYAWICLNNGLYDWITSVNLNKQSFAYARILNVSDAGHCIKSPYILLSSYWDRRIKNEHFPKGIMRESTCATRHFQGKGGRGFVELGRFDNYVVKNTRKRGPARKHFRVFSSRCS